MKTLLTIPVIFYISLFTFDAFAQWQPDVQLTNDPSISGTTLTNGRCIAAIGNVVHVVWHDNRNGNSEIYYKRSTDEGVVWGADTRLTNNVGSSDNPSVTVSGSVVHVVWNDASDGNNEIYYKRSTDDGVNWGSDTRLTNNSLTSWYPSVIVSGSVVHVVWFDDRDGNDEIYYKQSTDGGINWGVDKRLSNNIFFSAYPSVMVFGSVVHLVWFDNRDGNNQIYYKRSTDGGVNWGVDTQLTNNPAFSIASIAVYESIVHVAWTDNSNGNWEIYYKRSTDGGVNWGSDTRLTIDIATSAYPSVTVSGSVLHVVWYDYRDANFEIYYKRSTDGGINWEADTQLTNDPAISEFPFVAVSGSIVHAVWKDNRNGNYEIYYKRNPTGNITRIKNIDSENPNQYSLSQNYPNPFNPVTKIKFALPQSGYTSLKVYDISGKEISNLLNSIIQAGTYEVSFDASNLASGTYFYRLVVSSSNPIETSSFKETKKMFLIK